MTRSTVHGDRAGWKLITLRYPAFCPNCDTHLEPRDTAWWSEIGVRCRECHAAIAPAAPPRIDSKD